MTQPIYEIGPFLYEWDYTKKRLFVEEKIDIFEGDTVLICGDSGVGKSTFLSILKGFYLNQEKGRFTGKIIYNNQILTSSFVKHSDNNIALLVQNPFQQTIFSRAGHEFFYGLENQNASKNEMEQFKNSWADFCNFIKIENRKISQLSHGECQSLVLTSLMGSSPKVLLFDEPLAYLDEKHKNKIIELWATSKNKQTQIIVEHHIEELMPIANRVLYINVDGKIKEISHHDYYQQFLKEKTGPLSELYPTKEESNIGIAEQCTSIKYNRLRYLPDVALRMTDISFAHDFCENVLEDISLSVQSGEIILITGDNGEGKTTLLKLLGRILKKSSGKLSFKRNYQTIHERKISENMSFIFQNSDELFYFDTVEDELNSLSPTGNLVNENLDFIYQFLRIKTLKISPFLLSIGQKRRLGILMAFFQDRPIIIYDEPTFGQDLVSRHYIREIITRLKIENRLQIIVSHDDDLIIDLADRIFKVENKHVHEIKSKIHEK